MNLYFISQDVNNDYDTYNAAVVAARSARAAKMIHPGGQPDYNCCKSYNDWACPDFVKVELIGKAKNGTKIGVVCASFNAG